MYYKLTDMKQLIYITFLLLALTSFSQNNFKITYLKSSNGTLVENQDAILVFSNDKQSLISSESILSAKISYPFEQTIVNGLNYFQLAQLNSTTLITTKDSTSIGKQSFELTNETKKILGYNCKKVNLQPLLFLKKKL